MPLRPYLDILRTQGVPRLLGSALLGRMPIGMAGLAIVLLVREAGGSYATAGLVAGAYAVSLGVTAPVLGRLIDRVGQTRVLLPSAAVSAAAFVAIAVAAEAGARALLPVFAAVAGPPLPPVGACLRPPWSASPSCCSPGWARSPPPRRRGPGAASGARPTGPGRCAAAASAPCWPAS